MKNVLIAFSNPLLTNWVTTVLQRGGYNIEYTCKTGGDVIRVADFCTSPVVVNGFQFSDMTAETLNAALECRLAMVTVVLPHQRDLLERDDMLVVQYPLSSMDLLAAIEKAERLAACRAVGNGLGKPGPNHPNERPAEEKLLILKAKNNLMEQLQMTESQAHRFLQKSSMDRGLKLIDAARMVLDNTLPY
jgi:Response regulator with putative antiterminator output domain